MKGIILAGGLGTRLHPLTRVTNKHLLPVWNKPMVYYPIECLVTAGITDIMLVTGGNNAGEFLRLLGNGSEFGLKHLNYTYQAGEGGIGRPEPGRGHRRLHRTDQRVGVGPVGAHRGPGSVDDDPQPDPLAGVHDVLMHERPGEAGQPAHP